MSRFAVVFIFLAWIAIAVGSTLVGCSRAPSQREWGGELGARHAEVDQLLDTGKSDQARAVLERMFADLKARDVAGSPDGRQALQDVAYRLGTLALERKDARAALAYCDEALGLGVSEDLFSANLLVLRGTVREDLHQSAAAAADLQRALLINEALLGRAVPR